MHCPLKWELHKKYELDIPCDADSSTIITSALKDTFIKHFQMLGLRSPWTTGSSLKYLSKRWQEYRDKFAAFDIKTKQVVNDLAQAQQVVMDIDNIFAKNSDIVAVNFPIERTIRGYTITDNIDLILQHTKPEPYLQLIYFDTSINKNTNKSFDTSLRACVGYSAVHRDLVSYSTDVRVTKLHLLSGKASGLVLSRDYKVNYPRIISNLCKQMESRNTYPRPSAIFCKNCVFNNNCHWAIK